MKMIVDSVLNVLFPKLCLGCDSFLLDNEQHICSYCRFELPKTNHLFHHENEMFKKFYGIVPVASAGSLLYFEKKGIVQHLLHQLKYKNQEVVGRMLANMFEDDLSNSNFTRKNTCLVPVPLHPKKLKERGYNQIQSFCETIALNHNLNFEANTLIRTKYNTTQSKKNLIERNTQHTVFDLTDKLIVEENIVLVDDVLTTGSTLIDCFKILNRLPDKKISVLTIAYTHS